MRSLIKVSESLKLRKILPTFKLKSMNQTIVSTVAVISQMETTGCCIDTNLQVEQPASTAVSAQSVLHVTSDLPVEAGGDYRTSPRFTCSSVQSGEKRV